MTVASFETRPGRARVVVLGAGFGGLTVVRQLRRAPVQVTLLDRNNYHLFTPLLYQVASSLLNPSEVAQPIRKLVRPLRNCVFRMTEVHEVQLDQRRLRTDKGEIGYDYLVVAAGSESNYFGIANLEERSLGLKMLPDALRLRNWVLRRFEAAVWEQNPQRRAELLTFTVVGGGPTGVEYAGALSELISLVLSRDFRSLDVSLATVHLVEATGELLASFAPRLRRSALGALRRKGIEVLLNSSVERVEEDGLRLTDGRLIHSTSVVWTAGVRGASIGAGLSPAPGRAGRVPVLPTLQLPGHPEVMVIGDLAELDELPMLAQVAIQQGRLAAQNITAMVAGEQPQPFGYRDRGIMATIGRNAGVAQIGPLQLSGFAGWVMWLFIHLVNIVTFRARVATLLNWAWDYLAFDRPIRLLLRAERLDRSER